MKVVCISQDQCQAEVIIGCDACTRTLCQRCHITWCECQGMEYTVCRKADVEGWFGSKEEVPTL